jgi:hypothetical protein
MFEATTENFIQVYFSGLIVQAQPYLMDGWIGEWWDRRNNTNIFLMSPATCHKYLKFTEEFEKNKPLLMELR